MNHLVTYLVYGALLVAGVIGITLSVPLQAPAVVLLGLGGFLSAVGLLICKSQLKVANPKLLGLCLIATMYFTLRAWLSPVIDLGIEDLMLILPASLLYLLVAHTLPGLLGAKFRQGVAGIVLGILLLHIGAAFIQLSGGEGYSLAGYFSSANAASEARVSGMYSYYGSFANFAVIAGLLCLSLGIWGRFVLSLRVIMFVLGVMALGLALWSQSRSAAVSLVVATIVFGILISISIGRQSSELKHRAKSVLIMLGVCGLLVGITGGVWVFKSRASDASNGVENVVFGTGVRMQFWSMAAEQWVEYPLIGAGSRSYSYESFRYWSPNLPTGTTNPEFVHNEYLQLLCDYGIIGLLFILVLVGSHILIGVKRVILLADQVGECGIKKGSNAMALTIAGVSGLVAMMVHIAFDFRTHLLANLLLLVCCAAWIMPLSKQVVSEVKANYTKWIMVCVLSVLGFTAILMGGWQLWGGLPLIENKMSKEDGAWSPEAVSRAKWIPILEEVSKRSPHFKRFQKLGTLYRLEAAEHTSSEKEYFVQKAIAAYELSSERHPYNPIPTINLASIYAAAGEFEKADQAYKASSEMAKARESWFRMHSQWAALHQQWGSDLLQKENSKGAEIHFLRAKELFKESYDYAYFYQNKQWVVEYSRLLITYARCLDGQKKYAEAELLFQEGREQVNWDNWQVDTKLNFYYGKHFYERGKYVWYQRKPEQAFEMMKKAKAQLLQHKAMMKSDVEAGYDEQLAKIQKVIDFLEQTGIK